MANLFGIDVAAEVASAMSASDLTEATLRKFSAGTSADGEQLNPTEYSCHGVPPSVSVGGQSERSPNVTAGTGVARIVGKPLTDAGVRPEKGDLLIMDGVTYTIDDVGWDGYKAMFTLKVRGA